VFHTFYKGDKSRHREGTSTGLGLAISAKILDRHKAKYGCKNEERKGADEIARSGVLFYFIL
jgi:signal transduction histidine kinase